MILVFLAAVWIIVLGPSLLRRHRERGLGGVGSIHHFHRQLRVLQRSGREAAPPARRPDDARMAVATEHSYRYPDVHATPVLKVVGSDKVPVPALAFLGRNPRTNRRRRPSRPGPKRRPRPRTRLWPPPRCPPTRCPTRRHVRR